MIVCDINMPQMNGYQFIQAVRNFSTDKGRSRNNLAVALSALGKEEGQSHAQHRLSEASLKACATVDVTPNGCRVDRKPITKSGRQGCSVRGPGWLPIAEVNGFAA